MNTGNIGCLTAHLGSQRLTFLHAEGEERQAWGAFCHLLPSLLSQVPFSGLASLLGAVRTLVWSPSPLLSLPLPFSLVIISTCAYFCFVIITRSSLLCCRVAPKWKMQLRDSYVVGEVQVKPHRANTAANTPGCGSRKLLMAGAGRAPSHAAGGNGGWCTNFGNRLAVSQKLKDNYHVIQGLQSRVYTREK